MSSDDPSRHALRPPPTWRQLHPGEDERIESMQFRWFRDAPPAEKMAAMTRLNQMARRLALVGLRQRHPGAGEGELKRRLADLLLGPELARKAYGPGPDEPAGK